jgi:predicted nucleotidyltransferase
MPSDLVQIEKHRLKAYIEEKIGQFSEIAGIYLFGSALGRMRPDSDIDLGLILVPGAVKSEKELDFFLGKLYLALRNFEGHPFDLVSVRNVDTILAFEILRHGVPLLIKDEAVVLDVVEAISRRYADVYPRYKKALEIVTGVNF